jgi:hypothetical protein
MSKPPDLTLLEGNPRNAQRRDDANQTVQERYEQCVELAEGLARHWRKMLERGADPETMELANHRVYATGLIRAWMAWHRYLISYLILTKEERAAHRACLNLLKETETAISRNAHQGGSPALLDELAAGYRKAAQARNKATLTSVEVTPEEELEPEAT